MLAPAAVALLALSQLANPAGLLPAGAPVHITADHLRYDARSQVVTARGHCVIRTDQVSVKADAIDYNQETGVALARGNALAVSGVSAAIADALSVDLGTADIHVENGHFFGKKGVPPSALARATSPLELTRLGTTTFAASGRRFQRLADGDLWAESVQMTPCDCDPLRPHWSIRAPWARVTPGDHAWLFFPLIDVYKVPVLGLPVLYVPLTGRKSGLLVTKPHFSSQSGFGLEQPVFITLGRSYDLTVSPGFYLGNPSFTAYRTGPSAPPVTNSAYFFGMQGPTLGLDFRYVPALHTLGELNLNLVDDLRPTRVPIAQLDPVNTSPPGPDPLAGERQRHRGLRGSVWWRHEQELGGGFFDRADVNLLSDGYLLQDVTTDILQRANEYVRSTARLYRPTERDFVGLDVTVREDVRYGYHLFETDQAWAPVPGFTPPPRYGPNTLQRLPSFLYALPESALWGPLFGGLEVDATRLAGFSQGRTVGGHHGNLEDDGAYNAVVVPNPWLMGIYAAPGYQLPAGNFPEMGTGEARDRLDFHPHLSAELGSGALRARPYAALREDLYLGEVTGQVSQRGYALGGVQLSSELSRVFDTAGGPLRHAITPSLDVRAVPFVLGAPLNVYDELDRAIPYNHLAPDQSSGFAQAVAQVSQTLVQRRGALAAEVLRLDLGQELELGRAGGLADSFGLLRGAVGPVDGQIAARFDATHRRFDQAWALARWRDHRGDALEARYDGILLGGSARQRQGLDTLVGSPLPQSAQVAAALPFANQVHAAATAAVVGGLSVRYDVLFQSPGAGGTATGQAPVLLPPTQGSPINLSQQSIALGFAPACQCWKLEVIGVVLPRTDPSGRTTPFGSVDFRFNLTISNFGSFGT